MAKLEVQIGADNSELEKKIKEAEFNIKELSKLKANNIKLGLDTSELDKDIKSAKKYVNDLKSTVKDTGEAFQKDLTPKVANAGNTLTNFSRIAQDAPFGIIGIGNNLTATAESFGHLVTQTGSATGAFKALGASLLGGGGVLLAVSLVTTGLTLMSQNGLTVGDVFKKVTGTFDEFGNSIKKASEEGVKAASQEITQLNALISVAKNESLSKRERLIAVDELQKKYPGYLGNLTKEQILTGNITKETEALTKALVNRAIADKLSEGSADEQLKIYQSNAKLVKAKEETVKLQERLNTLNRSYGNDFNKLTDAQLNSYNRLVGAISASKAEEQKYRNEILKSNAFLNNRQAIINKLLASSILLNETPAGKTKSSTQTKEPIIPITNSLEPIDELVKVTNNLPEVIRANLSKIPGYFDENLLKSLQIMQQFNDEANAIITDSIGSTFANLGTAIGEALATGGNVFGAIGSTLLQGLGNFLSDMGDLLIKYGTLAVVKGKLDLAIATGGPAAIAAGIAAIGVGVGLKAIGKAISSKASQASSGGGGGSFSTGSNYSSPASGGSYSSSSGFNGTVVFEIDGTKLVGVLSNTLNKNTRLGGRLGL